MYNRCISLLLSLLLEGQFEITVKSNHWIALVSFTLCLNVIIVICFLNHNENRWCQLESQIIIIIIVIIGFAVDSYWMKNGSHFFKLAIQRSYIILIMFEQKTASFPFKGNLYQACKREIPWNLYFSKVMKPSCKTYYKLIAVIAVAPSGKVSFVCSYVQTRLRGQHNGKWPSSLVYVRRPLITAIRAIGKIS